MPETTLELNRWREKYLSQCEVFELREKSQQDYVQLLQRLLARVALVAEGQDEALDIELSGLRALLRKASPDTARLSNILGQINTWIQRLDEQHQASGHSGLETLQLLVDQLINLDISRKNKKALQNLSKKLKGKGNESHPYPMLLKEYARLQETVLTGYLADESKGNESGGIISRLFGDSDTDASQKSSSASQLKTTQARQQPSADDSRNSGRVSEKGFGQSIAESPDLPPEPISSSSAHLEPVCLVLSKLLDELGLPHEFREKAEQVHKRLDQGLRMKEFNVAVDDLAALIIDAAGKSQQDFENFLQSLNSRLVEINGYLEQSRKTEQERLSNSSEIDLKVRSNTASISEQVQTATDIDVLKSSVQQHIDTITTSMDGYIDAEKRREQVMSTQMEALKEKLALVENESSAIKKRLRVERNRALTDVLTRVPNREALNERMIMEWDRFHRYKKPISLAVLDIDHFKKINDKYGHLVGDRALQLVAETIKKSIRRADFVARFGGEEFVMLLPETKANRAEIAMNHLRETIAKMKCHFLNDEEHITVSIGIVSFRLGATLEDLFEYADKAL